MKFRKKHIKSLLAAIILAGVTLSSASVASANSRVISDEKAASVLKFSALIKDERLLTENITSIENLNLESLSPEDRIRHLRQYAEGTITLSHNLNPQEILSMYEKAIEFSGVERDKSVFALHKIFLSNFDRSNPRANTDVIVKLLEAETMNEDWFVANTAWLLLSITNSYANELNLALQQTQEAYALIPNKISTYVTDARISTLTRTAYLNNLLLNPELAIENTAELIAQKRSAGYPIDGSSLLNNILYSLSMWREYEISTQIAQIVLELETEVGSNTPGLTELRVAHLFDRQGDFETALKHVRQGLEVVEIPTLKNSLLFLEVNSLAGLGRITEAIDKLSELKALPESVKTSDTFQARLARAEFGLAVHNGDKKNIYNLSNQLLDYKTQRLLRSYSRDTSKLIASLETTKDRQSEREAGLKREASLQKSRAEQKARANQLLMVLVALLSLAALLAVIFARYRDNISKKLAIKTLEAEDADRIKSEFLGMVSHELRTPLNGIVGIADLLAMQAPTPDLRHKAGIILDSSNKLTQVIESIVDMSTIDGEKMILYPEPTNVHDIMTELEAFWRPEIESKDVIFTSFVENSLSEDIIIDKSRLRQCLNSLLSNAAKFTDSGRIHLHMTANPTDSAGETEITAIIADTGQGISKAVQDKLFKPFVQADSTMTRKHGGSGLGLSITQSLARMMGGDVTMVSNQGRGSEFTFTVRGEKSDEAKLMDDVEELLDMIPSVEMKPLLPKPLVQHTKQDDALILNDTLILEETDYAPIELASDASSLTEMKTVDIEINAPAARAEGTRRSDTDSLRGLKVLIVEDITANQDIIKLFLGPEGCESLSAENGLEALEILNTQDIDIILMDIRMPEMDGIDATHAIRGSNREYKNTPIIALTADVSAETNAACMAAGADIFLTKPIMARELIESIRFIRRFEDYDEVGVGAAA